MLRQDTQLKILGLLQQDLSFLSQYENYSVGLKEEMFDKEYKGDFSAMVKAESKGYDLITDEFRSKHGMSLYDTYENAENHFLDTVDVLRDVLSKKYKTELSGQLSNLWKQIDKASPEEEIELKDKAVELIMQSESVGVRSDSRTMAQLVKEELVYIEGRDRIPTYLDELDQEVLLGGFSRSGIHILAAKPGGTKTTSAVQFATLQAANNHKVLFMSLEQPKRKIMGNVLSVLAENRAFWDVDKLKQEDASNKQGKALDLVYKHLGNNLIIEDTHYASPDEFISRVKRAVFVEKFDVIYIDNFQNSPTDKKSNNVEQSYTKIAVALDAIIKKSNSVIVALSQLTGKDGQEITKYSSALNDYAITNIKLYRIQKDEEDIDPIDKVGMHILKTRDGRDPGEDLEFVFHSSRTVIGSFYVPERPSTIRFIDGIEEEVIVEKVYYKGEELPF